jgi:hypothetical protein
MIVGGVLLYRWLNTTAPVVVRARAKKMALWAAIGLLLLLVATGRLNWLVALVGSLLIGAQRLAPLLRYAPLLARLLSRGSVAGAATGAAAGDGQRSTVKTDYLQMSLEHGSGRLSGEVLRGRFAGRQLADLGLRELLLLLEELRREDRESVALLETYLDRSQGADWRKADAGAEARDASRSSMTREEAYQVLGLQTGADDEQIREAHRRLMQRLHPDRGGSGYLAATINRAKDVLLAR